MAHSARDYLTERFQSDALALRERVAAMARGSKLPGPDANTSRAMAEACEQVATMLQAVVQSDDAAASLDALAALIPLLEQRAAGQSHPALRAVYTGAATRIREIRTAEAAAAGRSDAIDAHATASDDPDDGFEDDPEDDGFEVDDDDDGAR